MPEVAPEGTALFTVDWTLPELSAHQEAFILFTATLKNGSCYAPAGFEVGHEEFALELPNQNGGWEFGLTRLSDGSSESWCWSAPEGFLPENAARQIRLQTSRAEKVTAYDAKIPFSTVGLTREMLNHGFRFNLLVNDNDGEGRRGWIAIAPGIGERKDPSLFPFIIFN